MDSAGTKCSTRVCIIGAGPSGLLTLNRFLKLGTHCPEVICYEKQSTWGGQWNFTWRTRWSKSNGNLTDLHIILTCGPTARTGFGITCSLWVADKKNSTHGTDEYGELVHSSIYKNLWVNAPKETLELPEYTFDEFFGRPLPSFITLPGFRAFLAGILNKSKVKVDDHIQYNTVVRNVKYERDADQFVVEANHLPTGKTIIKSFSHVVVANGIFSTPFVPEIEGIETFPGLVIPSHSVRRSEMFKSKRILLIGNMYSAEDVAIHAVKYGANHVIAAYRTKPRGFHWPDNVEERPMVTRITDSTAEFKDGTTAEFDMVIICTGYVYHFPFLEDNLRLEEKQTSLFPHHLYKGILWMKSGNQKLMYIGMQTTIYSLPMFDVQAAWIVKYVTGRDTFNMELSDFRSSVMKRSTSEIENELEEQQNVIKKVTCEQEAVDFSTDYCKKLADEVGYRIDFDDYRVVLNQDIANKADHIMTYRDDQFTSIYTGKLSPKPKIPWIQRFDDSLEEFLK